MCQNAVKTAGALMAAIEPTLKSLLTYTGLAETPQGIAVIAAYDAALTAVENWKSGTPAQDVLQILGDFQVAFNALPLPANVVLLTNIVLAGVEAVIGVLTANSPAPAGSVLGADANPEETQAQHQVQVITETTAKVQKLVPNFKRSIWHSAATQYKNQWNNTVTGMGPDYAAMLQ